jgi:hypothetical protein
MEAGKSKNITQTISFIVGLLLFVLGVAGSLYPTMAGLHLSRFHSIIFALAGITIFYNGYKDNERDSFIACLCFGLFFLFHAVVGFMYGPAANPGMTARAMDPELLRIIPNFTELGIRDHVINGIVGVVLLGGAMNWWTIQHERKRWNRHDRRRDYYNRLAHR